MNSKKAFLGIGWGFPPEFSEDLNEVVMISEEEDIKSSLEILLNTRLGERVLFPNYGCNLDDIIFEKLDRTLITNTKDQIETAILYHEPRIDVHRIDISETDPIEGQIVVKIEYTVRATNSRTNVVFPFYKGEGTDIN